MLDFACDNGVVVISLPPHCTHRLQPLDVLLFKALNLYYDEEIRSWLRLHPGQPVTEFQVTSLFSPAYAKAVSLANAMNGFRKSGIWPFNRDMFKGQIIYRPTVEGLGIRSVYYN